MVRSQFQLLLDCTDYTNLNKLSSSLFFMLCLQNGSIFEVKQNELLVLVPQNVVAKNERSVQTNFSLFGHSKQYCWVSNPKCNKKFVFFFER